MQIKFEYIVTNLFQNFERNLTDWFQIFTFSLKPLLANLKPNFITNLKLMIGLMFFMPRFVLSLTFL